MPQPSVTPASSRAERRRAAKLARRNKPAKAKPRPREESAAVRASGALCRLNYRAGLDNAERYREHRAWAERFAAPLYPADPSFRNDRDPERCLRVGYMSGDFRRHPAAFFVEPLLRCHDRARVRPFCYATHVEDDDLNRHLRSLVPDWRDVADLSDAEIAAQIGRDRIDLLVDLSGHTADNRLLVLARRPAPVQVTGIGYVGTTGMATVDYRLTDPWCDPPGTGDAYYSEALWRLPQGFNCYAPPRGLPEPGPLPALTAGHMTFGSFNNLDKIGDTVLALWGETVAAVPNARLAMKTKGLGRGAGRKHVLRVLGEHGLAPDRVTLIDWSPTLRDHFAHHGAIDIALDPFPYNGTTTTCEALMMGLPVIALIGDCHAARVSYSLLARLGLESLAAVDRDSYRRIATDLAGNPDALAKLRAGLRRRLASSPLADATAYGRSLEQAYRVMWRRWRDEAPPA